MSYLRVERKFSFSEERHLEKLFFDFYVMEPLSCFAAGSKTLNFSCRERAINEYLCVVVDRLFVHAMDALVASVFKEYEHADGGWIYQGKLSQGAERLSRVFKKKPRQVLDVIAKCFADLNYWESGYGGELWAEAAQMAMETPQTTKDKILWLDKLFDMQHNTGHILNKTDFCCLEGRSARFGFALNGKKSAIKLLNFRYKANLEQLSRFSSKRARKLLFANRNLIPKALFGNV